MTLKAQSDLSSFHPAHENHHPDCIHHPSKKYPIACGCSCAALREAEQIIRQLEVERNKAQANYQFMVDRAVVEKLDGYRELGQKCADLETKLDNLRGELKACRECHSGAMEQLRQLREASVQVCHEIEKDILVDGRVIHRPTVPHPELIAALHDLALYAGCTNVSWWKP